MGRHGKQQAFDRRLESSLFEQRLDRSVDPKTFPHAVEKGGPAEFPGAQELERPVAADLLLRLSGFFPVEIPTDAADEPAKLVQVGLVFAPEAVPDFSADFAFFRLAVVMDQLYVFFPFGSDSSNKHCSRSISLMQRSTNDATASCRAYGILGFSLRKCRSPNGKNPLRWAAGS